MVRALYFPRLEDGEVVFSNVRPGRTLLNRKSRSTESLALEFELGPGEQRHLGTHHLQRVAHATLWLSDSAGSPVSTPVTLVRPGLWRGLPLQTKGWTRTPNTHGRVKVDEFGEGPLWVLVGGRSGLARVRHEIHLAAGSRHDLVVPPGHQIQLELSEAPAHIRVDDSHGRPMFSHPLRGQAFWIEDGA